MMALWNSPLASGIASRTHTLAPPPDSPMMVTLPGSPPKASMLSRTHSSAATRLCRSPFAITRERLPRRPFRRSWRSRESPLKTVVR